MLFVDRPALSRASVAARALLGVFFTPLLFLLLAPSAQAAQAPAQAPAQADESCTRTPRTIAPGSRVRCRLRAEDPRTDRNTPYQDWTLELGANQTVQIDLESGDFDSYLQVFAAGETEALQTNDDRGGGSLNSRLFFTARRAGRFTVRATRLYGSDPGGYGLAVGQPSEELTPTPIADSTDGRLEATDPLGAGPGGGMRYDAYSFTVTATERVQVDLTSSDFDARLVVRNAAGEEIVQDDEGGENRNARAMMQLAPGQYVIHAGGAADQVGGYHLALSRRPMPLGRPVTTTLGEHDGTLNADSTAEVTSRGRITSFYDLYSIQLNAGQRVTIEARSSDMTIMLSAGVDSFIGFATRAVALGASGRPARIELTPTPGRRGGIAQIKVRSFNLSPLGRYRLIIRAGPPPAATDPEAE